MKKTWRWLGEKDKITLPMLREIGIEGVVTALHDVPNGEIWTLDAILDLRDDIESEGLEWSVVESLPVSELIKCGRADNRLIDNYILSLANLGTAEIKTVCYNFTPVIDRISFDINYAQAGEFTSLYPDQVYFAYFDCFILKRKDAEKNYSAKEMQRVYALDKTITEKEKSRLIDTISLNTKVFANDCTSNPLSILKSLLSLYNGVDKDELRENMKYFLNQMMPVCEEFGIKMCVYPDNLPYQIFGLPHIVTKLEDIEWILKTVYNPHNGLAICSDSLNPNIQNNIPELTRKFAANTHFIHLRSADMQINDDLIKVSQPREYEYMIKAMHNFEKYRPSVPVCVGHGHLSDFYNLRRFVH